MPAASRHRRLDDQACVELEVISGWRTLNWRIGMDNDGSALVVLEPSFREVSINSRKNFS